MLIVIGKWISHLIAFCNLGSGSTWPGHIALWANPQFIKQIIGKNQLKIIIVAGTNGKTTTASILSHILAHNGYKIFQNQSGANLLNGIASSLIIAANNWGKLDFEYVVFEIDENVIPLALAQMNPDFLVLLNLFRDQLDRYGEIANIAKKWILAIQKLPPQAQVILNADDPQIAYIGRNIQAKTAFYGLTETPQPSEATQYAADSLYCPQCGKKLIYTVNYFSHLGDYQCGACDFKRPELTIQNSFYPLAGVYNKYNALAATLTALKMGIDEGKITAAEKSFTPAFGRQEIIEVSGKRVQLFLAKNPTSFNQSYETIKTLGATVLCISLNDRTPDGTDVSWIWDVDFPKLSQFRHIFLTGDRVYDMALRLNYEGYQSFTAYPKPSDALREALSGLKEHETLFVLPTYSAMLDIREILTGRRIL